MEVAKCNCHEMSPRLNLKGLVTHDSFVTLKRSVSRITLHLLDVSRSITESYRPIVMTEMTGEAEYHPRKATNLDNSTGLITIQQPPFNVP